MSHSPLARHVSDSSLDVAATTRDKAIGGNAIGKNIAAKNVSDKKSDSSGAWLLKRAHLLSYACLYLFTIVVFYRPYDIVPALSGLTTMAFWIGLLTIIIYLPSQFMTEGNVSAPLREVKLLTLLTFFGLLSIPLAGNRLEAWDMWSGVFIKIFLVFVVLVNVVRTERRLIYLMMLGIVIGVALSIFAIDDFRLGNLALRGDRIKGADASMFANPNDLALHLAMMIPLVLALALSRSLVWRVIYILCAVVMLGGIVVTFSRGGFLGLAAGMFFFAWRVVRRYRVAVIVLAAVAFIGLILLAPDSYGGRLTSILNSNLDVTGSSQARQAQLIRAVIVTLAHPLFGVGMGNFHTYGYQEQVAHNAYLEVSAEMGIAALITYVLFIIFPLRRLGDAARLLVEQKVTRNNVEINKSEARRDRQMFFLMIGVQASIISYMVSSFFASVPYVWNIYYVVGYAVCLRRMYESRYGALPTTREKKEARKQAKRAKLGSRHVVASSVAP